VRVVLQQWPAVRTDAATSRAVRTDTVLETALNAICPWDRSVKALPVINPGWL
tara:strand:- start:281 stop:439 length:159 start_codon:yes stop_codon:yes gene_type:complete